MKIEFVIFIITVILIANTYYDGKLVKMLNTVKNSKYLKMVTFAFARVSSTSAGSTRPVPIRRIGSLDATGATGSQRPRRLSE